METKPIPIAVSQYLHLVRFMIVKYNQ